MCRETRIPRNMCAGNTIPGETRYPGKHISLWHLSARVQVTGRRNLFHLLFAFVSNILSLLMIHKQQVRWWRQPVLNLRRVPQAKRRGTWIKNYLTPSAKDKRTCCLCIGKRYQRRRERTNRRSQVMLAGYLYSCGRTYLWSQVCRYVIHKGLILLFASSPPINNPQILGILLQENSNVTLPDPFPQYIKRKGLATRDYA